jgi:hypothetical protein
MKTNSTQMEVLLLTGTSFSASQLSDKSEQAPKPSFSEKEKLAEACWNGLLPEMLPELCEQIPAGKKIYLWEINEADAFIDLEFAERPEEKDQYFSINPYVFTQAQPLS